MKQLKFFLTVLAVTLLNSTSYACVGSAHNCSSTFGTSEPFQIDGESETATTDLALAVTTENEDLTSSVEHSNYKFHSGLVARDNTRVVKAGVLAAFFVGALKKVAIWGGVQLTRLLVRKINRRATTYERHYNAGDSGVRKAALHWDDLQRRSTCSGREPDHNLQKVGFQGAEECPICSKQLDDLRRT